MNYHINVYTLWILKSKFYIVEADVETHCDQLFSTRWEEHKLRVSLEIDPKISINRIKIVYHKYLYKNV